MLLVAGGATELLSSRDLFGVVEVGKPHVVIEDERIIHLKQYWDDFVKHLSIVAPKLIG